MPRRGDLGDSRLHPLSPLWAGLALAAVFPLARLGLGGDPSPGLIVAALFICSTIYVALATSPG